MNAVSNSSQRIATAQEVSQAAVLVAKAGTTAPLAELRETVAEGIQNILMLEKALITAKQAEEDATSRYKQLFIACNRGDESTVRALLASGLDVNKHTQDGITPLHIAACDGHLGIVELLLERGAEVDPPMSEVTDLNHTGISLMNATPLCLAIANRRAAIAELLLKYGANQNVIMGDGMSWQEIKETVARLGGISLNIATN